MMGSLGLVFGGFEASTIYLDLIEQECLFSLVVGSHM